MSSKKDKFNKRWLLLGLLLFFVLFALPTGIYKSAGCDTGQYRRSSLLLGSSIDQIKEKDAKARSEKQIAEDTSRAAGREISVGCNQSYTYVQFII